MARDATVAGAMAQARMEDMLQVRRSMLSDGTDSVAQYDRRWTVVNDGTSSELRVWVDWPDMDGGTHTVHVVMTRAY